MTEIKRECASCGEVMNEEDMLTIGDNFYCTLSENIQILDRLLNIIEDCNE